MKKMLLIAAFLLAFVVGAFGVEQFRKMRFSNAVKEGSTQGFAELKANAEKDHPNDLKSVAMQKSATEQAAKMLSQETDANKKALAAAHMFWGFYFVNVRERRDFCNEQAVDISPFISKFEANHTAEIAKARSLYASASLNEEEVYDGMKANLRGLIDQDMQDIATPNQLTLKQACELLSANAVTVANGMMLSKMQPEMHRALMGTP